MCWGCAECGGMCRLRVSGTPPPKKKWGVGQAPTLGRSRGGPQAKGWDCFSQRCRPQRQLYCVLLGTTLHHRGLLAVTLRLQRGPCKRKDGTPRPLLRSSQQRLAVTGPLPMARGRALVRQSVRWWVHSVFGRMRKQGIAPGVGAYDRCAPGGGRGVGQWGRARPRPSCPLRVSLRGIGRASRGL